MTFVKTPENEIEPNKALVVVPTNKSPDDEMRAAICTDVSNTKALDKLIEMHELRRPAWSKTEKKWITKWIKPTGALPDKFGNYRLIIPNKNGSKPFVLWSSHTDTVHVFGGKQEIGYDKMEIGLTANAGGSNCLGADDTVGVWLMLQLIDRNVPGMYIFHREEEGGRKGSKWIANNEPDLFKDIRFAIALDRKGYSSVITHQMGSRCCSKDFVDSIASQLGLDYKADSTGSFTDTASYTDLVGECTNLSVGYREAHSSKERLDIGHAFRLRDALISMDQYGLVETRKPGEREFYHQQHFHQRHTPTGMYYSNGQYHYYDEYGRDDWVDPANAAHNRYDTGIAYGSEEKSANENEILRQLRGNGRTDLGVTKGWSKTAQKRNAKNEIDQIMPGAAQSGDDEEYDSGPMSRRDYEAVVHIVKSNPEAIADLLEGFGYGFDELCDEIIATQGTVHVK